MFVARLGGFLLLLIAAPVGMAATIYRCQNAHGVTEFSDHPCGPKAERLEIREPPRSGSVAPTPVAPPEQAELTPTNGEAAIPVDKPPRRQPSNCPPPLAILEAVRQRRVTLCMTMAEVDKAADLSFRDNFQTTTGGDSDGIYTIRYYHQVSEGWPRYIRFRDNRVAEFRDDAPPPPCAPHCGVDRYPAYPSYPVFPVSPTDRHHHEHRDYPGAGGIDIRIRLGDDRHQDPPPKRPRHPQNDETPPQP